MARNANNSLRVFAIHDIGFAIYPSLILVVLIWLAFRGWFDSPSIDEMKFSL